MGKPHYLQKSLTLPPKDIKATIYVQDPLIAEEHGSLLGRRTITLAGEPYLGAGPTSSRVAVVDYNADLDEVFAPVGVLARGGGFDVGRSDPRDNVRFHQVNVWAVITHVLDHIQSPKIFGRRIPWAFPRGRLLVLPHAGYWDNAFYDRGTGALHFFYFRGPEDRLVYTCLSHDIVAHELGHAVLDGLKPLYNEVTSADVAGFHEYFGDALAMTSALTMREVVVAVVGRAPKTLEGSTLVSDIAREFGMARGDGWGALRSAANQITYDDVKPIFEEHLRSVVLTGFFYDVLQALYEMELERHQVSPGNRKPGQLAVASLINAANYTSRMLLRAVDYCPPAGITYAEYARAIVRADEVAYPVDGRGYRAAVKDLLVKRGLVASEEDLRPQHRFNNSMFRRYDVEQLSSCATDAYGFVDANRELLHIPREVNLHVHSLCETRKVAHHGYYPPREVIVEFSWQEDVLLRGKRFGDLSGHRMPLWCGGTLVFDRNGNVLHYALSAADDQTRKSLLDYVAWLVRQGYIGVDAGEKGVGASGREGSRITANVDGRALRLHRNPALRHEGRRAVPHGH